MSEADVHTRRAMAINKQQASFTHIVLNFTEINFVGW